jgi:uncharacterized protein (DUF305 family)
MTALQEPGIDTPDPPAPADDHGDDGDRGEPWWHSPWKLAVLAVALVFLGVAAGFAYHETRSRPPGAGSVDVGFLQDMRWHHDQAVKMAYVYLRKPSADLNPALVTIAGEILLSQQLESGMMVQMLRSVDQPEANESGTCMAWMQMPAPCDRMVGMASDDDLQALGDAQGAEADRIFTQLMLAHHQGGLHMAEYAQQHASRADVRELAHSIVVGQQGEIDELQRLAAKST